MEQAPEPPSVDELVDELKRRVDQREREGLYPPELVDDLHEHFRRIAAHRSSTDLDDVRSRLQALDAAARFSPAKIPLESGVAGGAKFHALVGRLVARQTQGILEQVQQFADSLRVVLHAMAHAIEQPHAHVHADLVGQVDALFEQLTTLERGPADSAALLAGLRERVQALEDTERLRRFEPFFSKDRFEEAFRGTREDLLSRYRDLAARFRDSAPVLDIGCGRGEFLELLGADGIEARGVELDPDLAQECRARGFDVVHADGLDVLSGLDDDSLGGISLIQVVEHLTPQETVELVVLAAAKLRPGGRLILETVNPQSLYVYAHALYVDPTHTQPVHPAYLAFVVQEAGFSGVEIDWRSKPAPEEVLDEVEADDPVGKTLNENVRRLNTLLFAPQDYALIAIR
jgi:SAM-dependent methyltransferase